MYWVYSCHITTLIFIVIWNNHLNRIHYNCEVCPVLRFLKIRNVCLIKIHQQFTTKSEKNKKKNVKMVSVIKHSESKCTWWRKICILVSQFQRTENYCCCTYPIKCVKQINSIHKWELHKAFLNVPYIVVYEILIVHSVQENVCKLSSKNDDTTIETMCSLKLPGDRSIVC